MTPEPLYVARTTRTAGGYRIQLRTICTNRVAASVSGQTLSEAMREAEAMKHNANRGSAGDAARQYLKGIDKC